MAIDYYGKAIERLQKRREKSPYLPSAKAQVSQLGSQFKDIQRDLDVSLRAEGSAQARAEASQQMGEQYEQAVGGIYSQMNAQDRARVDAINEKIDELEFRKDIAEEEKAEEEKRLKDEKKKMLWQIGGQVGGAILGGILAIPTGGMSLMAGAAIGSSLGGAVGSFAGAGVGDDYDLALASQGVEQAIGGFSQWSTMKTTNDLSAGMDTFHKGIKDLPSNQQMQLLNIYMGKINAGDIKGALEFLNLNDWSNYLPTIPIGNYLAPPPTVAPIFR